MAPRKKTTPRRTSSSAPRRGSAGGGVGSLLFTAIKVSLILLIGVMGGYVWRSFYPIALPFESRLVADKSSADVEEGMMAEAMVRRARQAERERDTLQRRLEAAENEQRRTEQELADMKIRAMLSKGD
ncbi:MAG: hypothetical protein JJU11_04695 [Candidatus Sumerlaeia bacterium]|nr:hypothetical protein [Candidatus Sumerlaeia bacterium]